MAISGPFSLKELLRSKTGFTVTPEVPTGVLYPYAGSSAPSGYVLCDGSAISRTTYAELFAVLGTAYGSGDGSTTFNVPDLRGRVPAGADNMGGSAASRLTSGGSGVDGATLGATGGAETHTMTTTEMPSHTHTQNSHNHSQNPHTHYIFSGPAGGVHPTIQQNGNNGALYGPVQTVTATNNPATATNQNTGGGAAHNNVQPVVVTNYIIKT